MVNHLESKWHLPPDGSHKLLQKSLYIAKLGRWQSTSMYYIWILHLTCTVFLSWTGWKIKKNPVKLLYKNNQQRKSRACYWGWFVRTCLLSYEKNHLPSSLLKIAMPSGIPTKKNTADFSSRPFALQSCTYLEGHGEIGGIDPRLMLGGGGNFKKKRYPFLPDIMEKWRSTLREREYLEETHFPLLWLWEEEQLRI